MAHLVGLPHRRAARPVGGRELSDDRAARASCTRPTATGGTSTAARPCRSSGSRPATASTRIRPKLRTSAHVRRGPRRRRTTRRAYLAENEADGIWGSVIYPSQGLVMFSVPNTEVVTRGDARLQRLDRRVLLARHQPAQGHRDGQRRRARRGGRPSSPLPTTRPGRRPHHGRAARVAALPRDRSFDAFWQTAAELRHADLSAARRHRSWRPAWRRRRVRLDVKNVPPSVVRQQGLPGAPGARRPHLLRRVRAPPAACASARSSTSSAWIPFFLGQMDYTYTDKPPRRPGMAPLPDPDARPQPLLPARNCFASLPGRRRSACGCATSSASTPSCGAATIPHTESTFPRSRQILAEVLAGVPADEAAASSPAMPPTCTASNCRWGSGRPLRLEHPYDAPRQR